MNELIESSKEILQRAIIEHKPKAIVMMLSGGDDSTTAYHVAKQLDVKFDAVIHGYTRTGIKQTTQFAQQQTEEFSDKFILADASTSYVDYVMRKGFFGVGSKAHGYAYHILKANHFSKAVSRNLRKGRRNYPILFINGARKLESERRKITMKNPIKIDPSQKNNIWVNIINEWTKKDCLNYIEGNGIKRNPVSINLCRSGECMCGTMQTKGDRVEAKYFYPEWGKWLDDFEKVVLKKFPWGWGMNQPKSYQLEKHGQLNMFQPMCEGCNLNAPKSFKNL